MAIRAIAAMSLNRVIGKDGKIPWHLPEDFKWFKKMTTGHAILMGRKTYESIGRPLPNRCNLVATRGPEPGEGIEVIRDLDSFRPQDCQGDIWVIGGEEIYRRMLGRCEEIYLSLIPKVVDGDAFFPEFEDDFELIDVPLKTDDFEVQHYRRKS